METFHGETFTLLQHRADSQEGLLKGATHDNVEQDLSSDMMDPSDMDLYRISLSSVVAAIQRSKVERRGGQRRP